MQQLLTRLFRYEEINGAGRCPTYLHRWTLLQPKWAKGFGVYLHKFVGNDWSRDLHDHPKRFISIGLKGTYTELVPLVRVPKTRLVQPHEVHCTTTGTEVSTVYRAPWVRTFPADHVHRIVGPSPTRPCWTLVIVLAHVREWGFWTPTGWIHWRTYIKSADADQARDC